MKDKEARNVLLTMKVFFKTKKEVFETKLRKTKRKISKLKKEVIFEEDNIRSLEGIIENVKKTLTKGSEGSPYNEIDVVFIKKLFDIFQVIMKAPIEELKLAKRTTDALRGAGVNTIGDLVKKSPKELLEIKEIGKKSIEMIKRALWKLGLKLKD